MSAPARRIAIANLVPRHIEALCEIGRRAGLAVGEVEIEQINFDDAPPEDHLTVEWSGSGKQLFATGLFTPGQRRIIESPVSVDTFLSIPGDQRYTANWLRSPLVLGIAKGCADFITWRLYLGEVPHRVSQLGGVEICHSPEYVTRHGTAEALIAAGVKPEQLATGKRQRKSANRWVISSDPGEMYGPPTLWWGSCRQPDGTYLHREEMPHVFEARAKKIAERNAQYATACAKNFPPRPGSGAVRPSPRRSHLQLVVSNP